MWLKYSQLFRICLGILSMLGLHTLVHAQNLQKMNLQQCVEFAQMQNLQVQQAGYAISQNQLQYEQSKRNKLPNAQGSASYGYNYGFSVNPIDNQVVSSGLTSGNLSVNGGMPLYAGGQIQQTIRQNEVNVATAQMDLTQVKNNLALSVSQAYMQVLLSRELLENAKIQLNSTEEQLARTEKMIKAGSAAEMTRYALDAQYATEQLAIVNAQNNIDLAMLNLRQLLNIMPDVKFDIVVPDLTKFEPTNPAIVMDEVYRVAEHEQPNIKSADLRVRSAMHGIEIAKATRRPTLSAFLQTNTRFSSIAQRRTGEFFYQDQSIMINQTPVTISTKVPMFEKTPFFSQLSNNWGLGTGLSLNVPIYNRGQAINNIQLAELGLKNAQNAAAVQRQNLRQTIEQANLNLKVSYSNYIATQKQIEILSQTLYNVQKQLSLGAGNNTDFTLAKNNLNRANNDLIRAKYDCLFRLKILEFYEGKPMILE